MATQRKILSGRGSSQARTWEPPSVAENGTVGRRSGRRPITASQLESVHGQAYEDGFAQGVEDGRKQGYQEGVAQVRSEIGRQTELLGALLRNFAHPLEQLDAEVEESLVSLAMSVAKHLVRRELKSDPGQVIAVVREAVSALPVNSRQVRLHLHPEDAALVRDTLRVHEGDSSWEIVDDPVMTRGGCQVVTDTSRVDATVESRVAAGIGQVMGEERGT